MDLGALELQIFVSLVVVLGSAFVALVCDYLKGNNEQLRERNIELQVRTEEQERFAILNPSAWLSQFRGAFGGAADRTEQAVPVAAEAVMQSHAPVEGIAYAATREAALVQRSAEDGYRGESGVASIPDVAGFDVAKSRRARRKRGNSDEALATAPDSDSYDWVSPEVMDRVARRGGESSNDESEIAAEVAVERIETIPVVTAEVVSPLVTQAEVRVPLSVPEMSALDPTAPFLPLAAPTALLQLQTEIERVARTDSRPTVSSPPVIMLRPLPGLKLNEELRRIAESVPSDGSPYVSQLLNDVIAASAPKPVAPMAIEPAFEVVAEEAPMVAVTPAVALPEPVQESIYSPEVAFDPSILSEELPAPSVAFDESPVPTEVAPEAPAFIVAEPPPFIETPELFEYPTYDALPPVVETPAYDWAHAEFAPLPEPVFAAEAFAAQTFTMSSHQEESAAVVFVPAEPPALVEPEPVTVSVPELLLPTGMQDMATYRRLLDMPNPMSGIVITISINDYPRLARTVSAQELPGLLGSVETLMGSMVREGDFGVKVSDEQWIFVYRMDDQGFSQRRVAGLSEKLWDFQLRHLGLSNLSFSWAAVNVNAERLQDAVTAAIERMESSRRGSKKPGADRARLVVNG